MKLDAFCALKLGIAAGIYYREHSKTNRILVGKDTRRSGYMLENALVSGLTAVGYEVIQIGPMPTPAIAYLTEDMRCDGGIMVSASHNPFMDNGIKFFGRSGYKLDEKDEEIIERIYHDISQLENAQKKARKLVQANALMMWLGAISCTLKTLSQKTCPCMESVLC